MARLRNVDRYFLRVQQIDFPHATKTIAGPFETLTQVWQEKAHQEAAGDYSGCNLTHYRKSVPIALCHPKEPPHEAT